MTKISKIMALTALITLVFGMAAIDNAAEGATLQRKSGSHIYSFTEVIEWDDYRTPEEIAAGIWTFLNAINYMPGPVVQESTSVNQTVWSVSTTDETVAPYQHPDNPKSFGSSDVTLTMGAGAYVDSLVLDQFARGTLEDSMVAAGPWGAGWGYTISYALVNYQIVAEGAETGAVTVTMNVDLNAAGDIGGGAHDDYVLMAGYALGTGLTGDAEPGDYSDPVIGNIINATRGNSVYPPAFDDIDTPEKLKMETAQDQTETFYRTLTYNGAIGTDFQVLLVMYGAGYTYDGGLVPATFASTDGLLEAQVSVPSAALHISCNDDSGSFLEPFDRPLYFKGKKTNRNLPLKFSCVDESGTEVDDEYMASNGWAAPVVNVAFSASGGGTDPGFEADLVPGGLATDGNQFFHNGEHWMLVLGLKAYTAAGVYTISAVPGDDNYTMVVSETYQKLD